MVQEPLKYAALIAKSKEAQEKDEQQFIVEEAKQDIDAYILEQKKALASTKKNAHKSRTAVPFSIESVVKADQKVEELENGLKVLNALKKELF